MPRIDFRWSSALPHFIPMCLALDSYIFYCRSGLCGFPFCICSNIAENEGVRCPHNIEVWLCDYILDSIFDVIS